MSLFSKKKSASVCSCNNKCSENDSTSSSAPITEESGEIKSVRILGSGCKSCHNLLENTKEAALSMKLNVQVEYVTDMQKIMEYGVMSMPALVVNEKVVMTGKVPKASEIEKLLRQFSS